VHDLHRVLIDRLLDEFKNTPNLEKELRLTLEGVMEAVVRCLDKEYTRTRSESFFDISLPLVGVSAGSIESALEQYCKEEVEITHRMTISYKTVHNLLYDLSYHYQTEANSNKKRSCQICGDLAQKLDLSVQLRATISQSFLPSCSSISLGLLTMRNRTQGRS